MRKIILFLILGITLISTGYFCFIYFYSYSEGFRSGELIKFSSKGYIFKTWEGEISQGMTGNKIFTFSVLDNQVKVIQGLKDLQGQYVKVTYEEKIKTFPWWGDTKYFIKEVVKEKSPLTGK